MTPRILTTCAAMLLVGSSAAAQSKPASSLAAQIGSQLAPLAARGELSGVVLVARGDTVIFEEAYGLANVESMAPNRKDTRFRIHSITKQFTAAAVVLLARQEKLKLESSIRTYLPELPARWQSVSVLHLLTHTSGLPQLENQWFETFEQHAAASELENLGRFFPKIPIDSLSSVPGTKFEYNNFGYDLLACIIERVSGERFAESLRKNIFDPAGMKDAGFDTRADVGDGMYVASAVVPRLASGYNGPPNRLQNAFPLMFGSAGAGGMYATARDLFHYDMALNAQRLLGAEVERDNLARAFPVNDKTSYGFGWFIPRSAEGRYYLNHGGGNNGYNASYARYPADRVCIIVLSNRGAVATTEIRKSIARILLGTRYD